MPYSQNDPYFIYGLVGSDEWDWRNWGKMLAKTYWKGPFSFVRVDVQKLLGLLCRLDELEMQDGKNNR